MSLENHSSADEPRAKRLKTSLDSSIRQPPPDRCALSDEQICRYSRQLILPGIGVEGQERICNARVLVVGAGGLGSSVCLYLAGAGIGHIGIMDGDEVEESNLHRQVIHSTHQIGKNKAESARNACLALNPLIECTAYPVRLVPSNALKIFSGYTVIVDCTDNIPTRYLVNDSSVLSKAVLVAGSAVTTEGQLSVYNYKGGPCYRCIFPKRPGDLAVSSCSSEGVLGVVPGLIGCLQALEVLKVVAQLPSAEPTSNKLLVFDALSTRSRLVRLQGRRPDCASCGQGGGGHQAQARITAESLASDRDGFYRHRCVDPGALARLASFGEGAGRPEEASAALAASNVAASETQAAGQKAGDKEEVVLPATSASVQRLAELTPSFRAHYRAFASSRLSPAPQTSKEGVLDPLVASPSLSQAAAEFELPVRLLLDVRPAAQRAICCLPYSIGVPFSSLLSNSGAGRGRVLDCVHRAVAAAAAAPAAGVREPTAPIDSNEANEASPNRERNKERAAVPVEVYCLCKQGQVSQSAAAVLGRLFRQGKRLKQGTLELLGPGPAGEGATEGAKERPPCYRVAVYSVKGGMVAWHERVDARLPLY